MEAIIVNYDKLRGRIKEKLKTQTKLAELMKLDETTISNKLNNKAYFTQKEILKICSILDIRVEEIPIYFFNLKVRENEQIK